MQKTKVVHTVITAIINEIFPSSIIQYVINKMKLFFYQNKTR